MLCHIYDDVSGEEPIVFLILKLESSFDNQFPIQLPLFSLMQPINSLFLLVLLELLDIILLHIVQANLEFSFVQLMMLATELRLHIEPV